MIDANILSKCNKIDVAQINNIYNYIMKMIFGDDQEAINDFTKEFNNSVRKIETYPCQQEYMCKNKKSNQVSGCLEFNDDKTMNIITRGFYKDGNNYEQITTATHEMMHAITQIFVNNNPYIIKSIEHNDNMTLVKDGGCIFLECKNGINSDNNGYYVGLSLYEATNEFFTNLIINADQNNLDNYLKSNNANDRNFYETFIPITKLLSAAFSNNPYISYDYLANSNKGFFLSTTKMRNNKIRHTNEFISNMLINPLLVEKKYDKYMGKGEFANLIFCMQGIYNDMTSDSCKETYSDAFRDMMTDIAIFNERRCQHKYDSYEMNDKDIKLQKKNFNCIFNNTEKYYYENLDDKKNKIKNTNKNIKQLTKNKN